MRRADHHVLHLLGDAQGSRRPPRRDVTEGGIVTRPGSSSWGLSGGGPRHIEPCGGKRHADTTRAYQAGEKGTHTYGGKHVTRGPAQADRFKSAGLVGRVSVVLSLMHLLIQNGETVEAHGQQAAPQTPL